MRNILLLSYKVEVKRNHLKLVTKQNKNVKKKKEFVCFYIKQTY